ncbi:AraC family transcriptional regulator [Halotalea alkalilenta]|uniref:AraC family transcriptional regulator n=1 Tax=Halotalea alkalilenta TaxID=376489 RepID=A0A172YAP9_9GAMM|nr:AraC family transcriptional regulator [Halotalea alkalilenta]ANF56309.1 AraC family transcriptional regulator [Halotalea alkalilenta]
MTILEHSAPPSVAADYAARLAPRLASLADRGGFKPSMLEDVELLVSRCAQRRTPLIYNAGLVVIVQGGKIGFLGDRVIHYGAGHYLVQAMPLPFECETHASTQAPLLGLAIRLDRASLVELAAQLPGRREDPAPEPMAAVAIDAEFGEALSRLVDCLFDPVLCRALGAARLREVIFAALRGAQGEALRRLVLDGGHYPRIAEALRFLHEHYAESLNVDRLARAANMSASHFHHHFKVTTQLAPLQYLKRLRLLKARALLAEHACQVAQAASAVGYRSSSQFSREYKQYFGVSPTRERR